MKQDSSRMHNDRYFGIFEDNLNRFSDAQESQFGEIFRTPAEHSNAVHNIINNVEDYSDIYFDKSCINAEEPSLNDFSNYPKDINLEEDVISNEDAFLKPKIVDFSCV